MADKKGAFLLQYNYKFEIAPLAKKDDEESFLTLAGGITSIDPENEEEIEQDYYYDGGGEAESEVVGLQKIISFEGHRKYGDPAQDYIYQDLTHKKGPERRVYFRETFPDGAALEGEATVANIKDPGGDANSKGEIEFEIHFNGQPKYTPPTKEEEELGK